MKSMKKFFLFISSTFFLSNYSFAQINQDKIKVFFKEKVDIKFVEKVSKIISTNFIKINDTEYEFRINKIVTKDLLDKYSEFFSIMKNVKSIEPLPSIKSYDNINSNIYIRNDLPKYSSNQNIANTEKNEDNSNNNLDDLFSQPVNKEYNIKFKENVSNEDIENLKLLSGAKFEYDDKNKLYKVNIPEETDLDYTLSVLRNNEIIDSFSPVENKNISNKTNDNVEKQAKTNEISNLNNGIITTIPLNYQKDIKISFESDRENDIKWVISQLDGRILSKKGFNSFIVRFPSNVNPYMVIRAMKVCSGVISVQLSN